MSGCSDIVCNNNSIITEPKGEPFSDICAERSSGYSSNSPVTTEVPEAPNSFKPAEYVNCERDAIGSVDNRLSFGNLSECSSSWDLESPSCKSGKLGTLSEGVESDLDSVCASPVVEVNPFISSFRLSVCSLRSAFTYLDSAGIWT